MVFTRFFLLYSTLWPLLARTTTKIVTVSDYSKQRICERLHISPNKVEVIWNGIGENFAPQSEDAIEQAKSNCGIHGRPYFVVLGTLEPRKNLKLAFEAWKIASAKLPEEWVLLVVGGKGGAAFASDRETSTHNSERVQFTGYIAESLLPPILSGATALIYPSVYEGFGLPAVEAMGCGTPVLSCAVTSLPEIGGNAILYVDPNDPTDLTFRICQLAEDRQMRSVYSTRALNRSKLFNWSRAAQQMEAIFRQM